ncbi:MAG: glycoside hydrolase family 5 protein [Clostridium sp.]|nr:glycoside hydrolase family 5 protein [Clostridium sp.]MCM1547538.1 glycoside hydrolase family 5 protein [Ruminococcus sp.]
MRLPVDYNVFETEDGEYIESGFEYVSNAIAWCRKYGLNLVLDLHKTVGFTFDDPEYVDFFSNEELQNRFYMLWEQFAKRFGSNSDMLAFELLNEVTNKEFSDTWNKILNEAVKRIRKYSPDIKILVGGYWNCSVDAIYDIKLPDDKNIVMNIHCYDPVLFTHQSAYWIPGMPLDFHISYPGNVEEYRKKVDELGLEHMHVLDNYDKDSFDSSYFENRFKKAAEYCEKLGIPLYCGEYGVINQADPEETVKWYKDINAAFERFGIGRAAWSYKEVDYGFVDEHFKGVLDKVIPYL